MIVLAGAALGLAFNYLALQQGLPGALPWTPEAVPDLAEFQAPDGHPAEPVPQGGNPSVPPVERGVETVPPPATGYGEAMDDPLGIGAAPSAQESPGLPFVPDLDRPIQIQLPAVKRFVDANGAFVIDAREPEEYAEGHIPGSLNLPYDSVVTDPALLESLETGERPIITYCGGGTCEVSMSLAWSLLQAGHRRVMVFMGGWPEWQAAGYAVGSGSTP